jgi:uncharacterized protein with HEPN domain
VDLLLVWDVVENELPRLKQAAIRLQENLAAGSDPQ